MVVVIRAIVAACVLVGALTFAGQSRADPPVDLSGVWVAEQVGDAGRTSGGYFRAELAQGADGRLRGPGVIDPCSRCAGFQEYALTWEGGVVKGVLVLTGTPETSVGQRTVVRFVGQSVDDRFEGVVTWPRHERSMRVVMQRGELSP